MTILRNIEASKKAKFDPKLNIKDKKPSFIDTYFRGQTSEDHSSSFCNFSLPVKMDGLMEDFSEGSGNTILESYIKNRVEAGNETPVFKKLSQRYLLVKLEYPLEEVRS